MVTNIGKIVYYDGFYGKIVSEGKEYIFLDKDIEGEFIPNIDEYVCFRGEEIQKINRAYFIRDMNKKMESEESFGHNKEKQK